MGQRTPFGIYTNEPSLNTAEFKAAKKLSRGPTTESDISSPNRDVHALLH